MALIELQSRRQKSPALTEVPSPTTYAGRKVRYVKHPSELVDLPAQARADLEKVAEKYVFRANDYYLGLIDWNDPNDPIRQLIIPRVEELNEWGQLDASNEASNTVVPGTQHKYERTALLLCNEVCGAYCRYCFRKRLFMDENDEVTLDISAGLDYTRAHPEISNVLLTGGDPLLMSTRRLDRTLKALREIEHVKIIRIGTKMPAFNPWRILNDDALLESLRTHSTPEKRIYVMAHFDHPRELTPPAIEGLHKLLEAGVIVVNQCPLIKGVNDDADTLAELFQKLSFIGVPPYYLFQGRPVAGNEPYEVSLVRGYKLFEDARRQTSGLGRRARFCMSHDSGKIEMVGLDEKHIYLRYHQAKDPADEFRFMVCERDDDAFWFDQLKPVTL